MRFFHAAALLGVAGLMFGCSTGETGGDGGRDGGGDTGGDTGPVYPKCGSNSYSWQSMVPGPRDPGADGALHSLARAYDRAYLLFNAAPFGMNMDATVLLTHPENRNLIENFLKEKDGWDFKAFSGKEPSEVMDGWGDAVGLYGGAGGAAEAYRYGVLRDRGESCDEVERARQNVVKILDGLHMAVDVTGVPGVIARSITRRDLPGNDKIVTTPLFDEYGNPLPVEKNNGTMRADNSGRHPDWVWNDSCSRDMLVGWAMAFAAVHEVIKDDPSFDPALKARLRADALAIGTSLSVKRESGYDLEIRDADGRITFHGVMNENSIDRAYVPGAENGFYAIMALGIVAGLAYVAGDPTLDKYLKNELIKKRKLQVLARDAMKWVDMGVQSNFSNYNMAFTGAWLALRYVPDADARKVVREATASALYNVPGRDRQPSEQEMSFYDFIYAVAVSGESVYSGPDAPPDPGALERGVGTLKGFPFPPYWDYTIVNCDEDEIKALSCTAVDGTHLDLLAELGRGDKVVAKKVVPMRTRPPSNYVWRSNPYEVNGGGSGDRMNPAVDFRAAYWMGQWSRR